MQICVIKIYLIESNTVKIATESVLMLFSIRNNKTIHCFYHLPQTKEVFLLIRSDILPPVDTYSPLPLYTKPGDFIVPNMNFDGTSK